jgi:hypothetical protein
MKTPESYKDRLKLISLDHRLNDCKAKLSAVNARYCLDEQKLLEHIVDLQERLEQALAVNEYYKSRLREEGVKHVVST